MFADIHSQHELLSLDDIYSTQRKFLQLQLYRNLTSDNSIKVNWLHEVWTIYKQTTKTRPKQLTALIKYTLAIKVRLNLQCYCFKIKCRILHDAMSLRL